MEDNMIVNERIVSYIHSLEKTNSEVLEKIEEQAHIDNVPIIRKEMESFLRVMLYIKKPKRILGYSAILMSECIDEDGKITTIENYEKRIVEAKKNIELSGKGQIIELLEGDATEVMKTLPSQQFDFVFMDAAKAQYIYFCRRFCV